LIRWQYFLKWVWHIPASSGQRSMYLSLPIQKLTKLLQFKSVNIHWFLDWINNPQAITKYGFRKWTSHVQHIKPSNLEHVTLTHCKLWHPTYGWCVFHEFHAKNWVFCLNQKGILQIYHFRVNRDLPINFLGYPMFKPVWHPSMFIQRQGLHHNGTSRTEANLTQSAGKRSS
jgi:hypothetical protein